jgi:hypothetical protein
MASSPDEAGIGAGVFGGSDDGLIRVQRVLVSCAPGTPQHRGQGGELASIQARSASGYRRASAAWTPRRKGVSALIAAFSGDRAAERQGSAGTISCAPLNPFVYARHG